MPVPLATWCIDLVISQARSVVRVRRVAGFYGKHLVLGFLAPMASGYPLLQRLSNVSPQSCNPPSEVDLRTCILRALIFL